MRATKGISRRSISARSARGFTLVEMVAGIVVFSIVLVVVTTVIAPQSSRSVEPILQVRATELAQSLLNEITAKSYDEQSDRLTGVHRCDEPGQNPCSAPATFGANDPGETSRSDFDDVDDYHNFSLDGENLTDSVGQPLIVDGVALYSGFTINVSVSYDGDFDGQPDSLTNAKRIEVSVTTPSDMTLVFSAYRSNI